MKEHFNSVKPIYDGQHNPGVFSPGFSSRQLEKAPVTDEFSSDVPGLNADDMYNGRINRSDTYGEEFIAGMDLSTALESIDAINTMSRDSKGSQMMSQAHNPVDTREVLKIFGIS